MLVRLYYMYVIAFSTRSYVYIIYLWIYVSLVLNPDFHA
jgi:hypothetical protein